jgi:nucleoside-diphosphate-sugar epimerase/rhodanese-related sulfurtransferase
MPNERAVILITGSSGLIGSAVIKRLSAPAGSRSPAAPTTSHALVGFDREGPPHPPIEAECINVDLAKDQTVREGLARVQHAYGQRIASVVHLAAYYDFSGEPSPLYDEITVRGTQRLLRGLRDGGFHVEQFIFSSTMLVHAPCNPPHLPRCINEDSPLEPKWDYPKSKVETEALLRKERGDIPLVILRIAGVYIDRCQSIPLAHQMQRIFERKMIARVFPGDISHGQAFAHLDDVIEAVRLAIEQRQQLPRESTLLIGEDETLSYDELQRTFSSLIHGEEWETKQIPKALAKTGAWLQDVAPGEGPFIKPWMIDLADDHYALDISRAWKTLGWKPKRSLRDTLPKMVAALKADPLRFYRDNDLEPPSWLETAAKVAATEAALAKDQATPPSRTERAAEHTRGQGAHTMNTITATQLKRMIDGDEQFELINVLSEKDFQKEHIPGSSNVPVDRKDLATAVEDRVSGDKDHKIVVYCASPQCDASSKAAQALERAGFTNVQRYEGGMQEWKNAGHPIESGAVRA